MNAFQLTSRRCRAAGTAAATFAAILAMSSLALAAQPQPASQYAGSGTVCDNNTPTGQFTACLPTNQSDHFSFKTSSVGRSILGFSAQIGPIFCGNVTETITVKRMAIKPGGSFSASFSSPNRGPDGKVNGTNHVHVSGEFTSTDAARVFYRLFTLFNVTPVQTSGAQVRGVAHLG